MPTQTKEDQVKELIALLEQEQSDLKKAKKRLINLNEQVARRQALVNNYKVKLVNLGHITLVSKF